MPQRQTIVFTMLELTGLWTRATGGDTSADPELDQAAVNAIDKVRRAGNGMAKKATPPIHPKRGAPITCGKASGSRRD